MSDRRFVVVTGAAGGIGRAIVAEFAKAGYSVIATDRVKGPGLLEAAAYIEADLGLMVADESYAATIFATVQSELGSHGLTALVNNAAVQILRGAENLTRADWRATIDVNVIAPFLWTQALLPWLERGPGTVVNVSSIHARLTKRNFVAYATSKAALSAMTRSLAVDLGDRVRVNAIEPAAVGTEMLRASFDGEPAALDRLKACHPQRRIGDPSEVAALVHDVVDGRFAFLHGACLALDGGIGNVLHDPNA